MLRRPINANVNQSPLATEPEIALDQFTKRFTSWNYIHRQGGKEAERESRLGNTGS